MQVRILGPTSVLDGERTEVALGGRLRGALVALLAVHANRPVPLERIVEDLWSGDPPRSAMASLHSHASSLRRALGAQRLRTRGGGYELVLAAEELDASAFEMELEDPELLAAAALALGRINWWGSVLSPAASAEVMAALAEALAAQPPGDSLTRVRLLSIMASNPHAWESRETNLGKARQALEMAERLDQPRARAAALHGLRWATMGPEDYQGQVATSEAIVALGDLAGDPALSFTGNHTAILAHLALGDMDAVTAAQERGRRLAERLGDPVAHLFCDNLDTMRVVLRGELEEADRRAAVSRERAARMDELAARLMAVSQLGMIRRLQGRLEELLPWIRATSDVFANLLGTGMLAALLAEAGHLEEARPPFEQAAANDFAEVRPDLLCLIVLRHLTVACTLLGDVPRAALLHDRLLPYAGRQITLGWGEGCVGTTDRLLGRLDTTTGNWDGAERHFQDAMELSRRIGSPPYVAEVACDHADMLDRRRSPGDAARAAGLRAEAAEIARRLGFPVLLERALRSGVAPADRQRARTRGGAAPAG